MSKNTINLEDMAEVSVDKENNNKAEATKDIDDNKDNNTNKEANVQKSNVQKDVNNLFTLPFSIAMKNLNLDEKFVLEIAEQMLIDGEIHYKLELPKDNYIILTSRKASEELDYYTFLASALTKELTEQEFEYMLRIRNLAAITEEIKIGKKEEVFKDSDIDYRFNKLLELSSVMVNLLLARTAKFQSALLLMMHPKAVDFLMKSLQN